VADIVTADPGRTLPADVVAIADVSRYERLGWCAERLDPTAQVVVLDHHLEDHPEGDLCFVDPSYASVGEIVVDLFDAAGQPLSREAAECAYVASITDTGGFRYSNTNRRTHQIAARLVATGLDVAGISARVFDEISCAKFCLMRALLNEARMLCGGRLAVGVLSFDVMEECQARDQDAEGLVNMLRNIEGVDLALLFREPEPGRVKLSSRSKAGLDCAALLRRFGGGGHAAAAGASFEGDIYEVSALVTAAAQETLGGRR
jgi:phosphoesterase RecJ-like protein